MEQFNVKEIIDEINELMDILDHTTLQEMLNDFHPADIADILHYSNDKNKITIFKLLDHDIASETLTYLDDYVRDHILHSMDTKNISKMIEDMESDDVTDLIHDLPADVKEEVLSKMDKEDVEDVKELLAHHEESAGGIMAKEYVDVNESLTIDQAVQEVRQQAQEIEHVFYVFVVNDIGMLVGVLSLKTLIIAPPEKKVSEVMNPDVISVKVGMDQEEVAHIVKKYDLVSLPVVDDSGILVGRITIDDIVDVIDDEVSEDIHKIGGMEALPDRYLAVPIATMIKKRAVWLVVLFISEMLTASVMTYFENAIAKAVVLALFIPLIISSGGNSGSQAATLIIRALAVGEVTIRDWWKIMSREVISGLVLGIILGIIGFLRIVVWSSFSHVYGDHPVLVGLTVGFSLLGIVLWGTLSGSLLPIILKSLKLDPATSSAPFVATLVDVTGLLIYFTFAYLFLSGTLL